MVWFISESRIQDQFSVVYFYFVIGRPDGADTPMFIFFYKPAGPNAPFIAPFRSVPFVDKVLFPIINRKGGKYQNRLSMSFRGLGFEIASFWRSLAEISPRNQVYGRFFLKNRIIPLRILYLQPNYQKRIKNPRT